MEDVQTAEPIESAILTPEEVVEVNSDVETQTPEDVVLPSEQGEDPYANLSTEELLAKVRELTADTQPPKEETTPPEAPPVNVVKDYMAKYEANGNKLSDADYADLEQQGYDKEFVDTYIDGVKASNVKAAEDLVKDIGGLEKFNEAKLWAAENWTQDEIAVFDKAIKEANTSEDKSTVKVLLNSLMKEYNTSSIKPNAPIHTNTPPKQDVKGYASKADMTKDMNDPRYGKDAVYTHKVEENMGLTDMSLWYK